MQLTGKECVSRNEQNKSWKETFDYKRKDCQRRKVFNLEYVSPALIQNYCFYRNTEFHLPSCNCLFVTVIKSSVILIYILK
jgi:hypothetical protein